MAPLDGDRVFLYVLETKAVMDVYNNAAEIFHKFLYDCRSLSKDCETMYERGV